MVLDELGSDEASLWIKQMLLNHYRMAAEFVEGKRVLDIACGCGYGSEILQQAGAREVVGVDLSEEAIAIARRDHSHSRTTFLVANAETFTSDEEFDIVVSFETVEHLRHPVPFLSKLRELMASDGQLWVSVPIGETRDLDPYHLHRFEQDEFFGMLQQSGFSVGLHQTDATRIRLRHFIAWGKAYPDEQPTWRELLFSWRGLSLIRRTALNWGYPLSSLVVCAKP